MPPASQERKDSEQRKRSAEHTLPTWHLEGSQQTNTNWSYNPGVISLEGQPFGNTLPRENPTKPSFRVCPWRQHGTGVVKDKCLPTGWSHRHFRCLPCQCTEEESTQVRLEVLTVPSKSAHPEFPTYFNPWFTSSSPPHALPGRNPELLTKNSAGNVFNE